MYKVIEGKFNDYYRIYSFKTLIDFSVGDIAVVIAAGKIQVLEVTSTECSESSRAAATRWAFQKVDLQELQRLNDLDAKERAKEKRRKELLKRLESMVKDQDLSDRFKALAESNPEAREMLDELKGLSLWTE